MPAPGGPTIRVCPRSPTWRLTRNGVAPRCRCVHQRRTVPRHQRRRILLRASPHGRDRHHVGQVQRVKDDAPCIAVSIARKAPAPGIQRIDRFDPARESEILNRLHHESGRFVEASLVRRRSRGSASCRGRTEHRPTRPHSWLPRRRLPSPGRTEFVGPVSVRSNWSFQPRTFDRHFRRVLSRSPRASSGSRRIARVCQRYSMARLSSAPRMPGKLSLREIRQWRSPGDAWSRFSERCLQPGPATQQHRLGMRGSHGRATGWSSVGNAAVNVAEKIIMDVRKTSLVGEPLPSEASHLKQGTKQVFERCDPALKS